MPTLRFSAPMPVSAAELFDWHRRPGAFARLTPPWEDAKVIAMTGPLAEGTRWTIRTRLLGPLKINWIAEHHDVIAERQFCDRQLRGPFAEWDHTHRFVPSGESSILEDSIDYRLPLGWLGRAADVLIAKRLRTMFAYRQAVTAEDLRRHEQFRNRPRLTVAITGSRGLIGSELANFLTTGGHRVLRLVSGKIEKTAIDDGTTWQPWQPREPLPAGMLKGVDALVHLAGDSLASGRWTAAKKARIRSSRVIPTQHLAKAVQRDGVPAFLSGSALGIYGDRGDEELTEDSSTGTGFLAEVAREWEAASQCDSRVVHLRTGIVLSPKSGALAKQLPAFRLGGGAVLGNGRQYISWIGIHDMIYAIHHLMMSPDMDGPVNLSAPSPVTNRVFGRTLAMVLYRPYLLTVPPFALRLLFGEMADEALLAGARAAPAKLLRSGFAFARTNLESELRFLLGRPQ